MAKFVLAARVLHRSALSNVFYCKMTTHAECTAEKIGLVLGVYTVDDKADVFKFTTAAQKFNEETNGCLLEHLKLAVPSVKKGKGQLFFNLEPKFPVVAVVGIGKEDAGYNEQEEIDEGRENVRIAASEGCKKLREVGVTSVLLESLGDAESAAEGAMLGSWLFQAYKNKQKQKKFPKVELFEAECEEERTAWEKGVIKAQAQNVARTLTDTPANYMTPTLFAKYVSELYSSNGVNVTFRDKEWAESKKMCSFLSVSEGSAQPPAFLELCYEGASDEKPIALVGKGVTFDSGGISLKPPTKMDEMRGDMGGAACVVATIYAASLLKLKVNIIGLIPLTENLPSGTATKPGDVVYAMNGKSIIVDNTDAEGRLILADALCYAQEFDPQLTLDIATLTGAIRVALSDACIGVYSNSTPHFKKLQEASVVSGDRVWRMPLWKHYTRMVTDSNTADLLNSVPSAAGGGSCTAAAFLREFTKGDWMHLDIANVNLTGGSSSIPYLAKGMTGRPTRTLIEFFSSMAENTCK